MMKILKLITANYEIIQCQMKRKPGIRYRATILLEQLYFKYFCSRVILYCTLNSRDLTITALVSF